MAEVTGPIADRLRAIQERYDPRMAAELPPHITLSGSSGMGPIPSTTTPAELRAALEPIATSTPPLVVRFAPPMRFMQSTVVVLPIDPHGPIRALHERIKASGLPFEPARFTFTPHCTLSFYPELSRQGYAELLRIRIDEPVDVGAIQAYRATDTGRSERVLHLRLEGKESGPEGGP
jgi:2'-5' RNA ligase